VRTIIATNPCGSKEGLKNFSLLNPVFIVRFDHQNSSYRAVGGWRVLVLTSFQPCGGGFTSGEGNRQSLKELKSSARPLRMINQNRASNYFRTVFLQI
jgi:hypothetical protein